MHRTEWMRCKAVLTSCTIPHSMTSPVVWVLLKNVDFSPSWSSEGKALDLYSVTAASHVQLLVNGFHFLGARLGDVLEKVHFVIKRFHHQVMQGDVREILAELVRASLVLLLKVPGFPSRG